MAATTSPTGSPRRWEGARNAETVVRAKLLCARVALTALEEIGKPFETGLIAFMAGEHRQPAFLALNPSGKVPALETPFGILVQTGAILGYLADSHPDAALLPQPSDPFERALIRAELFRCSADLHPHRDALRYPANDDRRRRRRTGHPRDRAADARVPARSGRCAARRERVVSR